jgi:hypothetical protein
MKTCLSFHLFKPLKYSKDAQKRIKLAVALGLITTARSYLLMPQNLLAGFTGLIQTFLFQGGSPHPSFSIPRATIYGTCLAVFATADISSAAAQLLAKLSACVGMFWVDFLP